MTDHIGSVAMSEAATALIAAIEAEPKSAYGATPQEHPSWQRKVLKPALDNLRAALSCRSEEEPVDVSAYTACGGCGASKPTDRCIGCLHNFGGGSWNPETALAQDVAPVSFKDPGPQGQPIGYVSEYGLKTLASKAHHYSLSVSKSPENEFQYPVYADPAPAPNLQPPAFITGWDMEAGYTPPDKVFVNGITYVPAPAEDAAGDNFRHRLIENAFSWALESCNYLDPKAMDRLIAMTEGGMIPEAAAVWRSDAPEILARRAKLLRQHWSSFCDADPFPGSDKFADRMEAAGFIELVPVTKAALQDAFAAERGIERGGMMYRLTDAGRAVLATSKDAN